MVSYYIDELKNFSHDEKSIFNKPIFGKHEDLNTQFILEFDKFVSWVKETEGAERGRCIIHDFNMEEHEGEDHYGGIAADFHFQDVPTHRAYQYAIWWNWKVIGVYTNWRHDGFHISGRQEKKHIIWYAEWKDPQHPEKGQNYFYNTSRPLKVARYIAAL